MTWRPRFAVLVLTVTALSLLPRAAEASPERERAEPGVVTAETPPEERDAIPVELSAEVSAMSRYLWRGLALSQRAASSFLLELTVGPCEVGGELVQPWFEVDGSPTPIELYAAAKCRIALGDELSISPLAEYWVFPAGDIWQAGYFGVELAYNFGSFTVATEQAVIVGDADNAYYGEVSLLWSEAFGPVEVDARTSLGWGDRTFMHTMQEVIGHGGLNQLDVTLTVSWAFDPHMSLFISGYLVGLLTKALHAKEDTSLLGAGLIGLRGSMNL